jgi:hypothetical protein
MYKSLIIGIFIISLFFSSCGKDVIEIEDLVGDYCGESYSSTSWSHNDQFIRLSPDKMNTIVLDDISKTEARLRGNQIYIPLQQVSTFGFYSEVDRAGKWNEDDRSINYEIHQTQNVKGKPTSSIRTYNVAMFQKGFFDLSGMYKNKHVRLNIYNDKGILYGDLEIDYWNKTHGWNRIKIGLRDGGCTPFIEYGFYEDKFTGLKNNLGGDGKVLGNSLSLWIDSDIKGLNTYLYKEGFYENSLLSKE